MHRAPVRLGLIGNARITQTRILPAIGRATGVAAAAIAARDAAAAAETARAYGIPASFGSYDALLADRDVEAVYIALPNALHAEWTLRALAAGKHVLCEKPLATRAEDVERIAAAATAAGRVAVEGMMIRHHPRWAALPALIADGAIGELRAIQGHFAFMLPDVGNIRASAALGGGVLADLGIYLVTAASLITSRIPTRVCATIDRRAEVDRAATLTLDFAGVTASGHCAFDVPRSQAMSVLGSAGTIAMPQPFNPAPDAATELILTDVERAGRTVSFAPADQFALQLDDFAAAVRGDRPPAYPLAQSLAAQRVIDALRRSAAEARWVALQD